jgi:hypothetical protein
MKHFSEQEWVDFVRGIGQPRVNSDIEAHIVGGCPDCERADWMWRKVHSITGNEPRLTPPDDVVRMAKLGFATSTSPTPSLWTVARLTFDSFNQPLTAGVRSGASTSRQFVFAADETIVDLVLDVGPEPGTVSLVGQVVDKPGAQIAPRKVSVILWTETGQPLLETSTNEFGEFQMEIAGQNRLRLSVEIAGNKSIRIPPLHPLPEGTRPVT